MWIHGGVQKAEVKGREWFCLILRLKPSNTDIGPEGRLIGSRPRRS